MSTELEPLDADVLSLLRAARPIADLEPAAKAAILASVEAALVLPLPPGGGAGGGAGGAGAGGSALAGAGLSGARAIAAIAATFAIGVATGVTVAPSVSPPPMTVLAASLTTAAQAPPLAAPSASAEPSMPAVAVGSLPSAVATASAKVSKNPSSVATTNTDPSVDPTVAAAFARLALVTVFRRVYTPSPSFRSNWTLPDETVEEVMNARLESPLNDTDWMSLPNT